MARKPSDPYREVGLDQPAMRVVLPAKTAHNPSQAHTRGTRPSTVTNAIRVGQQLAEALRAARTLIERTPTDLNVMVEQLRGWYYHQHPADRDRLLWQRFTGAEQIYGRLEDAIGVAREPLEEERLALVQVEVERNALAAHPLPATVEEAATDPRVNAVERYQSLKIERQARQAATAELERLLPSPEQILNQLTEAIVRVLEAAVTIDREAFVRRLRESGKLEHLRARFERLRTLANTHEAEIEEWSRRSGRPVRIPRITFPWPPAAVWDALLAAVAEAPKLVWNIPTHLTD